MLKNAVLIMLVALLTVAIPSTSVPLFEGVEGRYIFYTNTSVSSDFVYAQSSTARQVKSGLKYICGEAIEFNFSEQTLKSIIDKYSAKKLFSECGEGFETYYYYTNKIPFYELIGGVKVNLQVSYSTDICIVGSPIIYGGF